MIVQEKPPLDEALLVHYGVKGMRWGVRKERTPAEKRALAKKVAIGTGALLLVVGGAAVAYHLRKNRKVSTRDIASTAAKGHEALKAVLQEPVDVIHSSRGQYQGFRFLKTGGLPDPLQTYSNAFTTSEADTKELFKKLSDGKVAARFLDPLGRSDFAGRQIPHEVIVPKAMADGVNDINDVKNKIWPLIKDQYDTFYEGSTKR